MEKYDPRTVEAKWQKIWAEQGLSRVPDTVSGKDNYYQLVEFSYPSGNLHVGHWYAFAVPDVHARFRRMQGKNVLYPMGFDAFGLPAENAAIKRGLNPRDWTYQNMEHMRTQLSSMGAMFDWSREVVTCDPAYYRWTQWLFLQFFKAGLAEQKETLANWCPKDKTVLANEQVAQGKCDRCGTAVEKKIMKQWQLGITQYADRLLEDLEALDWPEEIKTSQRNWIGKSEGAEIDFALNLGKKYKFVILHGYKSRADRPRWQWVKEELERMGHKVVIPQLPHTDEPIEAEQVEAALSATEYDENTVLIGHSLGAVVAMKTLQRLNKKIARLVLIAPAIDPAFEGAVTRPFHKTFEWNIDYELIKGLAPSRLILSDLKEPIIRINYLKWLASHIDAQLVETYAEKELFTADKEPDILMWLRPTMRVFTTRPDTLYGATYLVLSPEHPWVTLAIREDHTGVLANQEEVRAYVEAAKKKSEIERVAEGREKTGVLLEGVTAINPGTGQEIPLYVADYVLANYGTGAIMAVPAHDERDFEFAQKFALPIVEVVVEQVTPRLEEGIYRRIAVVVLENVQGEVLMQKITRAGITQYGLPGGGIEENEEALAGALRELEEETGYYDVAEVRSLGTVEASYYNAFRKINRQALATGLYARLASDKQKELQLTDFEKETDLENFWVSKEEALALLTSKEALASGEDACLFRRYLSATNPVWTGQGILMDSEEFTGIDSREAKEKIIERVGGRMVNTYRLRDWGVSRQRYWGCPIPLVYCEKCGWQAVPDEELPVILPEVEDYLPNDEGQSPLSKNPEFVKAVCPGCGGTARRETDTLDTFVDSSWYFLRYCDPLNEKTFADKEKLKAWMPADLYSGGAEHTTMHLLYSRFFHKALFDLGLVNENEPYVRRMNRGLIMGPDGAKMSKSKGNVIDPDQVVKELGADSLRMYLAFIGPYNEVGNYPWNPESVIGVKRFLDRVWKLHTKADASIEDNQPVIERALQHTLKTVTESIESMKMNTGVAALMGCLNVLERQTVISRKEFALFLTILAPYVPHITEELWRELGEEESIHLVPWPQYDASKIQEETVTIGIQINGKLRDTLTITPDADEIEIEAQALAREKIQTHLAGKTPKKVIVVPGRIVNIVV